MPPLMSSSRDPTARLRAGLNPLLTASLGVYHGHGSNSTPLSAMSVSSHGAFSSGQTPVSAIQPYNPQEWIASPIVGPGGGAERMQQLHHQPAQSFHEPQPSPPPPPPYSPPRSQMGRPMSMAFESGQGGSGVSAARAPPPPVGRIGPDTPAAATSFPPPPGGRGGSRERRFGLPSLSRRRDQEQASTPIEPHPQQHHPQPPRPHGMMARTMPGHPGPLTLQIPATVVPDPNQILPPGARRAASTPAVATPTSARSRSSSQIRWDPAQQMGVPPPPPGPPPSAARSQSVQRVSSGPDPIMSPPTRRPPPSGVTALGPVPPTPANWQDDDRIPDQPQAQQQQSQRPESPNHRLSQSTNESSLSSAGSSSAQPESAASSASSAGGALSRAHAVRGEGTLRERRTASRTRGVYTNSIDGSIEGQQLTDIVIPSSGTGLQRRLTINRGTPRRGGSSETPRTADSFDGGTSHESRGSTPRAMGGSSAQVQSGQLTPTRLSPQSSKHPEIYHHPLAPKALPTPPTGSRSSSGSHRGGAGSEILTPAPTSPIPSARYPSKQTVISQSTEQFARATIERFADFAHKESSAPSDAERVRLFAEFFVSESRIRRERYGQAIGAMGSEILDLTRDLFRPMAARRESSNSATSGPIQLTPQSSEPPRSHRGSVGSAFGGGGQPAGTPTSSGQPSSPMAGPSSSSGGGNNPPNWQSSSYMPSLSPILSMSVSDALDEEDSRGRPASRWWEADSSGNNSSKIERSKRESKYMGVPKEAREALQWVDEPHPSPAATANAAGPSNRASLTDYPPEKAGWHDLQDPSGGTPQPRNSYHSVSTPTTPNPEHLDVSRLVTLPPPYPRHHPAVNNNHPELTQTRNQVRVISDMTEVDAIKERFKQGSAKVRGEAAEAAKQRRQALRQNLQQEITSGSIGYAEAAAIEADAKTAEHDAVKDLEKKDFDDFQTAVVVPVNEILQDRITKATSLFDELRSQLFNETHNSNPNLPQEEGDEQPELLEKLTLLKWIFEAREMLHRALYDLLTDRNDRYRDMVLVPYKLANADDKVVSAKAFFAEDAAKRALTFSEEVLHRTQEFRDVVEETVVRGVEVQLSAFWDIAPPLKQLLDRVSENGEMESLRIQIPAAEYDENPSYVDHPLQYLFSLLLHAEKSTYQFIESQTNLLCLLHEVKEACVSAKVKVMENEGRDASRVEQVRGDERGRLTDDLKEKVRVVQDQWISALGETIGGVKERVGGWLLETGGWDESLEDGGVGCGV
ncbi:hypothetical protein B0H66DRAFT_275704 [Apodospora peruviana]|uniref:Uncharacterized protein n=1 Tax=Apodospora peruviana TaxID=516989 RepID=A0AAE0HZX3_9PEZI|nr:hypothetical protein B0H66DRAFT_275704 [Apodospora peruviana]